MPERMNKPLKVHVLQYDIVWHDPDANFDTIRRMLQNITAQGLIVLNQLNLLVLPEMFTTGFSMDTQQADLTDGKTLSFLQQIAKEKQALVLGSAIIKHENHYFNRLFAVHPNGNFATYDKRHLFRMANEQDYYAAGQHQLIIKYEGWRIMPLICYDLRFPVWSRNRLNAENGYDLLIYIANWPSKRIHHWERLLQARAIENQCYAIGCNRIGTDAKNIHYSGNSLIINFHGDILQKEVDNESILQTELSYEELSKYRKYFPAYLDADEFSLPNTSIHLKDLGSS